jgi:cytidine deaminase
MTDAATIAEELRRLLANAHAPYSGVHVAAAVTDGRKSIARVYVASSLPELVWPCGGCRQKIFEFSTEGCEVVSLAPDGEVGRQTIEQLLPRGFRLNTTQVHPE